MFRDGSYDNEWDRLSTASSPVGLKKDDGNCTTECVIRRTSSVDDVSRYHRYFGLLQKHHGKGFKWILYANILYDSIRSYKTPDVPVKMETCSSAYATEFERTSWVPMQPKELIGRSKYRDSATNTTLRCSCGLGSPAFVATPERTRSAARESMQSEKPSIRSRCRDMITRASPSNYTLSSKKPNGENKSPFREFSNTIDKIVKITRKKSNKQVKHLVHTINKKGYTPVSSGYSSSEYIDNSSSGSVLSVRTPLTPLSTSRGKRTRERKKRSGIGNAYAY